MPDVLAIQRALSARGYDPGPIDGVRGRLTITAIKQFQRAHDLDVDGIVGPRTAAELFKAAPGTPEAKGELPPWIPEADRFRGMKEVKGKGSNQAILDLADELSPWVQSFYRSDDIPWCGLFVAAVIAAVLTEEPLPTNPLSALAWEGFGVPIAPVFGAVAVFKREGGGHVGFAIGQDASAIHVLGGNQSDSVSIARMPRSRLKGFRWPKTAPAPEKLVLPTRKPGDLSLSVNEA